MTAEGLPILIVGAGPSGLVLAIALLKNNIPIRIIDKASSFHHASRGAGLQPRTEEIEYVLGAWPDMEQVIGPIPQMAAYDKNDRTKIVKTWSLGEDIPSSPAFPFTKPHIVSQYVHEGVLRKHIEELGGTIELNTQLINFTEVDNGVTAEMIRQDEQGPSSQTGRFSYVVGTDGAKSVVRKTLGIQFSGTTHEEQRIFLFDCRVDNLSSELWHLMGDASTGGVTFRPLHESPGYFSGVAWCKSPEDLVHLKDAAKLQAHINSLSGRDDLLVSDIRWQSDWRANLRIAEAFHRGRAFIAGDAAHVHSPTGGQGLNSSVQDSFNLGWKLALVWRGIAAKSLLDTYSAERLPVIAEMLDLSSDLLKKTFNATTESLAKLERKEDSPWHRGLKLTQLLVNYRWSPIVFDERYDESEKALFPAYGDPAMRDEAVRAGDRAPDAPDVVVVAEQKRMRLFDLFDPTKHTALVFCGLASSSAILEVLSRYTPHVLHPVVIFPAGTALTTSNSEVTCLVDEGGQAYAGYSVDTSNLTTVIVRPDAMIGAVVMGTVGIHKYFTGILSNFTG